MNSILGMLELSLGEQLEDSVREYLGTAHGSAQRLLVLLNDLLDYSHLHLKPLPLDLAPFDVRETVSLGVEEFARQAREKHLSFECLIHEGVPPKLIGDARRLRQIVANLTSNAVKFTESGGIKVHLSVRSRDSVSADIVLVVGDTGIGIAEADQRRIFEPFTQVDTSTTRRFPGAGLGLNIADELTKRMNGRLWVQSQLGHGARFFCELSLKLPTERPDAIDRNLLVSELTGPSAVAPSQPLRILVAEDTPANQKVVRALLSKYGHVVEVAHNGAEAVELLRKNPFDVVLMDVQMPLMDGLQATAAIRQLPQPEKAAIPIIAMTAQAMPGDRGKCLAAGMSDYLPKPFDATKLLRCVEYYGGSENLATRRRGH